MDAVWTGRRQSLEARFSSTLRILYLDQIKALMVGVLILSDAWVGMIVFSPQSSLPSPSSQWLPSLSNDLWPANLCNYFVAAMLCLVSGYFLPRSVHRQGVKCFLMRRVMRLGLPCLAAGLLFHNHDLVSRSWPSSQGLLFARNWHSLIPSSFGFEWFLLVLLSLNILYCCWISWHGTRFAIDTRVPIPGWKSWFGSAAALAIVQVLVVATGDYWTIFKGRSLDAYWSQIPYILTCTFCFVVGCKAASHRWFDHLDARSVLPWFCVSLGLVALLTPLGFWVVNDPQNHQYSSQFFLLCHLVRPFIALGLMSALLLWMQRYEFLGGTWLSSVGRDALGASLFHVPVLVFLLSAASFIPHSSSLLTWLCVSLLAVVISFSLSHELRRIPAVSTFL